MLAPGAAGPEGVDAQVLFLDVDFDAVVHLRQHLDRGKGGVAAAAGVEGRDAHQAVDARLALQVAEGVGAAGGEGDALDARFVPGQEVDGFALEPLALGVAQIHAQQDFGPILGFGAAGAGVNGDDGVLLVFFGAQEELQFPIPESFLQPGQLRGHFPQGPVVLLFHRQVQEHLQVLHLFLPLLVILHRLQQGGPFPEDVGGPSLVVPQFRGGQQFFDMPQPDLFAGQIKDDLGGALTYP